MAEIYFFISYKWTMYSGQAKELFTIARSRGFTAWLDVEHPFQMEGHGSDKALADHLRNAMDSCRYILFFETSAKMVMQIGGSPIRVTSWQERELGMAASEKLITLYHGASPRSIGFGTSPTPYKYRELADAFRMVETAITNGGKYLWEK